MGIWDKIFNSPTYKKPTTSGTGAYPMVAPTPYVGQPAVQHPVGFPQLPMSELQRQSGQIVLSGNEKSYYPQYGSGGTVKGTSASAERPVFGPQEPTALDRANQIGEAEIGDPYGFGGGGGGGISAAQAAYDNMRREMQRLADAERSTIESRRDTLLGQTEAEYGDQVKYLDTQEQNIRGQADSGRNKVATQKEMAVQAAGQEAETAAKMARDTYKDLIIQGRRRARATGAGGSSGYIEITGMLDKQLMTGLGQVEQTRQNKLITSNKIAEQAVADIELSLNEVLGDLNNNRAMSLREKDKVSNEIRMNAADALLEVDKWVTNQFADIDMAKANLRSGGGGGSSANYSKAVKESNINSILGNFDQRINSAATARDYTSDFGQRLFQGIIPALTQQGMSPSQINSLKGLYFPGTPTSAYGQYQEDPEGYLDFLARSEAAKNP